MRVLHMPTNTASRVSYTVRAERAIGLDAYGIVFAGAVTQSVAGLHAIPLGNRKQPVQVAYSSLRMLSALARYLRSGQPDIIHWYYNGFADRLYLDWLLLRVLNKPGVVELTGADIRIPEIEFAENPYYVAVYHNGYEYRHIESRQNSRKRQQRFARVGFVPVIMTGMAQYIQPDIFPRFYSVQQRLILSEFEPHYPDTKNRRPLVIHSPTAPIGKGTAAVLSAIEQLQSHYSFDFRLIQGMPRHAALALMQTADIILDQFVVGDRGLVAVEAMAYGKPVICYLKPSLVAAYPPEN
ncbi:MAG: hypothetical protein GYB67_19685, partial [Chloroflexi bacterium]|nr:hypothetical protein [Chloroflexota bacterium]